MLSAPYYPLINCQDERYVKFFKSGFKVLASKCVTLQMKVNISLYRNIPHITKVGESCILSLFLKHHIRRKKLIVPSVTKFVHDKQNVWNYNAKLNYFKINQKMALKNNTPEAIWNIG